MVYLPVAGLAGFPWKRSRLHEYCCNVLSFC